VFIPDLLAPVNWKEFEYVLVSLSNAADSMGYNLEKMSPCPRVFSFIFTLSRREAVLVGGTAWRMAICC
jgi:hypothetical protein